MEVESRREGVAQKSVGSPLYEAVERRHVEVVELLLAFGADSRRLSGDGRNSPLALAEAKSDWEMVALLGKGMRSEREIMARM
jgi:ankyrin repeat protein